MNSIAVCDTEPIAINGLKALLESTGELRVVASASTLIGGLDIVRGLQPRILMLDKAFGIHGVMDLVRNLQESAGRTAVIVKRVVLRGRGSSAHSAARPAWSARQRPSKLC